MFQTEKWRQKPIITEINNCLQQIQVADKSNDLIISTDSEDIKGK
jgi:hypothetical protein